MSGQITKKRSTNGVYEMLSKSFKHLNSRKAAAAAAAAAKSLQSCPTLCDPKEDY